MNPRAILSNPKTYSSVKCLQRCVENDGPPHPVSGVASLLRYWIGNLVEEGLGLAKDVLELRELEEVLLQHLLVRIHFPQLVLQLLERRLGGEEAESVDAGLSRK